MSADERARRALKYQLSPFAGVFRARLGVHEIDRKYK